MNHDHHEQQHRRELHAFGEGADDQRRGDGREGHLEADEGQLGDVDTLGEGGGDRVGRDALQEQLVERADVRVLKGAIYDVVVDIRPNSPKYGRWIGTALSADEGEQLFIPRGFAHGFLTLSSETIVSYKVDAPYSRESEAGIRWNDPELNVRWPLIYSEIVLSEKDALLPLFNGSAGATHKNIRAVES